MESGERNRILLVLFLGVLMGALDISIVGPALPAIQNSFQLDARALSWIFSIYVLFFMVGTPFMAKLSDRYGRRPIYILDVSLFAIGSLITAIAPSYEVLLLGRAIQGFGAGGIFPVASAFIGDTFPPERRGSALGIIGAVFGLSFIIGPLLGGLLIGFGWQWLFLINLPIAALIIGLSFKYLPLTKLSIRIPFDWKGMLILGAAIASLAFGISELDTNNILGSLNSILVWPFLLIFLILLPIFYRVEKQAEDPVIRTTLFKSRDVTLTSLISVFSGISEASLVFIPALAIVSLELSNAQASLMLMPVVVAMSIGAPLAGRLLDRTGPRPLMIGGGVVLVLGLILLSFTATQLLFFIASGLLIGVGLASLLGAPVRYIMLNETQAQDRAAGQALININTSAGQLVGGALIGAAIASLGGGLAGYTAAYLFIGIVAVIMVLLAWGLKKKIKN